MKTWHVVVFAVFLTTLIIGPVLPEPWGHVFERQVLHFGYGFMVWPLTFAVFQWVYRRAWLPRLKDWWGFVVPIFVAWSLISFREIVDLARAVAPWWKSLFDSAYWLVSILAAWWLDYRHNEQMQATIRELKR